MPAPLSTRAEEPCDRVGDGDGGKSHVIVEFFSGIGGMRFAAESWAAAGNGRKVLPRAPCTSERAAMLTHALCG